MPDNGTFPALEELKADTEGLDVLVEVAPPGLAAVTEWVFEIDYQDRKADLLERRETVRQAFQHHRQRVEKTYGSAVTRALNRREDGDMPRFDIARMKTELADAQSALQRLHDEIDEEFLTPPERRRLAELEADVNTAHAYVVNKARFDQRRAAVSPDIERFQEVFAPYRGAERYMITSDQELLEELSMSIWVDIADMARELALETLPDDDAEWLATEKTRFGGLADYIPDYNQEYVANERARYADLFTTQHGPLNGQQQKAVIRNDRRNLVDASAGTGKTLTLTYRFIYLLQKGVSVRDIAAITYTSDAAEEMKSRIAEATDVDETDLNISTIHSFANGIYRQAHGAEAEETDIGEAREQLVESFLEAADAGIAPKSADVTFDDHYAAFKRGYDQFLAVEKDHGEKGYIADYKRFTETRAKFLTRKFEEFVKKARTFDRSSDEIRLQLDGTNELRDTFGEAGAALVAAYNIVVQQEGTPTDFDDMIREATRLVEEGNHTERYSHLLVDEFQDVTDETLSFVEAFLQDDNDTHLFCVGDDWQSIFGFTGSNVRHFTQYEERFDDVTYTELQVNYRCPEMIVKAGEDLIGASAAPQNDKSVRADSDVEMTPKLHNLEDLYEPFVVDYVADMVEYQLENGRDYDEVMVLSRNDGGSDYMTDLHDELERRGIPHRRPKNWDDYLPAEYRDELPYEVTLDDKGFATYDVPEEVDPPDEGPPVVATQSIHASKGTEAPVVILLHAIDNDSDGIPIEERTEPTLEPATDITADHIPEERRLFYVALTRTEEEFHAIARPSAESRYIEGIRGYFQERRFEPPEEFVGRCTDYKPAAHANAPIKATLDCDGIELPLLAWPNQNPPDLEKGTRYRLSITDTNSQIDKNEYGEEIRFDRAPIERL